MIVSWNGRGLSKPSKILEISSHLCNLNLDILVILKTRVKKNNARIVRDKLKLHYVYLDNYDKHENGRIWMS